MLPFGNIEPGIGQSKSNVPDRELSWGIRGKNLGTIPVPEYWYERTGEERASGFSPEEIAAYAQHCEAKNVWYDAVAHQT
jgi:hypothetical protein